MTSHSPVSTAGRPRAVLHPAVLGQLDMGRRVAQQAPLTQATNAEFLVVKSSFTADLARGFLMQGNFFASLPLCLRQIERN